MFTDTVSNIGRDLIDSMLTLDEERRLSIDEVSQHSWFSNHPVSLMREHLEEPKETILDRIISKGFKKETVKEYLKKNLKNQATTTYYLLLQEAKKKEQSL